VKCMLRKLRTALSTSEGKLKAVILVSGILVFMLVFLVGALELTSTPSFCKSCHEMSPEYYTWQGSAHNQVACVKCHIKPGTANLIKHKIESASQLYYHFTGSYVTPIEMKEKIDNSICEQCHDMNKRVTTPSGDIKFPHSTHLKQSVDCVACHAGVVHGSIEEKGFTAVTDFDSWNLPVGKSYTSGPVSKYFIRLTMDQCMNCHKTKNAPQTCETCHSKIVKPADHRAKEWTGVHGPKAFADIEGCDKCHAITSKYRGMLPQGITIVDYARTNTFCNDCHSKSDSKHASDWRKSHVTPAKESRALCLVCHDLAPPKDGKIPPAKITCQACHVMKHKPNIYLGPHPIKIPASGYSAMCTKCHSAEGCEKCHIQTQPRVKPKMEMRLPYSN
jgi:nitrate/TMAO reductase-like tetraheme cytochrome c subunit